MTAALVQALGTNTVSSFQYYLSSPIVLARERQELTGRNNRGTLHLDNTYTRETITFDGNTKGEVVAVETNAAGKLTLIVCFGPDTTLSLRFVQTGDDGYFDLETIRDEIVLYGSEEYHVLSNEKLIRTRLLISMDGKNTIKDERHTAPGRNPGDEKNVPPETLDKNDIDLKRGKNVGQAAPDDSLSPTGENFSIVPTLYIGNPIVLPPPALPESLSKAAPLSDAPAAGPQYRVQVGAFVNADNARQTIDRLSAAGFNSDYVRQGKYYRVIIAGVSAKDIPDVTGRLRSAGFGKPWIY
jgi:hypothetical protein